MTHRLVIRYKKDTDILYLEHYTNPRAPIEVNMKPNELIEALENIPKNDHNYHLYYLSFNNEDELMKKCLKKRDNPQEWEILYSKRQIWARQQGLYYKVLLYNKKNDMYRNITITTDHNYQQKKYESLYGNNWWIIRGNMAHYGYWCACRELINLHRKMLNLPKYISTGS